MTLRSAASVLGITLALASSQVVLPADPPRAEEGSPSQPADGSRGPRTIAFLVVDGVYDTELTAPVDVLQHIRFHSKEDWPETFLVSPDGKPVRTFEGLIVTPEHSFDTAPEIDVLVVPSAEHSMDSDLQDERLIRWVRDVGSRAQNVISLCDGAFVLAQAGLLDDLEATTFPSDQDRFAQMFPRVKLVRDVSFVDAGRALTSVGGAKSFDVSLWWVERTYGADVARGIGRGMVIDWDASGIPHRIVAPAGASAPGPGGPEPASAPAAGAEPEPSAPPAPGTAKEPPPARRAREMLEEARRTAQAGDLEKADASLHRAREIAEAGAPGEIELLAEIDFALGHVSIARGNLGHAEEYLKRAEEGFSLVEPTDNPAHAATMLDLGMLRMDLGDLDAACDYLRLSTEITERQSGRSLPLAVPLVGLAGCEMRRGHLEDADAASKRALEIVERAGPTAAEMLGQTLLQRLHLMQEMGRRDEAARIEERLLSLGLSPVASPQD